VDLQDVEEEHVVRQTPIWSLRHSMVPWNLIWQSESDTMWRFAPIPSRRHVTLRVPFQVDGPNRFQFMHSWLPDIQRIRFS
jgi:hypothetical protein